jgi:hypothetical protein
MRQSSSRRPSAALLVALLALVAALAGTATALPGKGQVKANDIKKNAVKGKHVKKNALKGADIDEDSLSTVPSAATAEGVALIPLTRATPTPGFTEAAARAAAPKVALYSKGPLAVYGKCFSSGGDLWVETLIETSVEGAVFDSREDSLSGGVAASDYLNPDTAEADRQIDTDDIVANRTSWDNEDDSDFSALAPDGTPIRGFVNNGAKQGAVAFEGGFGAGDGCLWNGYVIG